MANVNALTQMLAGLAVPHDRIIYIHSSMDWLGRADISVGAAMDALCDWVENEGGTLVLPAFPFRGSHEAYLKGEPTFDVRRTPARVGLLNETLRRRDRVRRSLDPDLSVIALGPQAESVVGSGFTGPDPTGADSPFQRVIDLGGTLLGLGVSLNYMNMVHVLDSRYKDRYPFDIYSGSTYVAHTVDTSGCLHHVTKQAMLNELQIHIRPSRIVHLLQPEPDIFRGEKIGETDFFVWDLPRWEKLCVAHIEQSLAAGGFPCWLAEAEPHLGRKNSQFANMTRPSP